MKAASQGRIDASGIAGAFARHINLCLDCRACETACPSGVPYGDLLQRTRMELRLGESLPWGDRLFQWILRKTLVRRSLLRLLAKAAWLYQAVGIRRLLRLLPRLPGKVTYWEALLPPLNLRRVDYCKPAPARGMPRGRVALFIGCIQDALLPSVNQATIRILQRNGYEVVFPASQTCCGAAHFHMGDLGTARSLARRNIDAFLGGDYDAVISNAGGCGAMLRTEYPQLLADDPDYRRRAVQFAERVRDISEFLAGNLQVSPGGWLPFRATYSDSCHLRHVQKVSRQPRELLQQIPGLQLLELRQPDLCCGSAGVYNLIEVTTSQAVLELKMRDIARLDVDFVATSNVGCHLQLLHGVRKARMASKVMHVAELLEISYQLEESSPGCATPRE